VNRAQRDVVALTLLVAGILCLWKAWVRIYEPSHDLLGVVHTDAQVNWSGIPMGWVLGGLAAIGAAALVRNSGPKS
jgi:HAMP domain-containing protein